MDLYYDEKIGAWKVKKEPYICLEIAAKEQYELYKKMVAYWWDHHDAEGNEKSPKEQNAVCTHVFVESGFLWCGKCHAVVRRGHKFCHECGAKIDWSRVGAVG